MREDSGTFWLCAGGRRAFTVALWRHYDSTTASATLTTITSIYSHNPSMIYHPHPWQPIYPGTSLCHHFAIFLSARIAIPPRHPTSTQHHPHLHSKHPPSRFGIVAISSSIGRQQRTEPRKRGHHVDWATYRSEILASKYETYEIRRIQPTTTFSLHLYLFRNIQDTSAPWNFPGSNIDGYVLLAIDSRVVAIFS
jgi:hypothetical protein